MEIMVLTKDMNVISHGPTGRKRFEHLSAGEFVLPTGDTDGESIWVMSMAGLILVKKTDVAKEI